MITLGIRYLCGYAAATNPTSRQRVEWPPHPGRVFMALAAAHFETGADPRERAALEWLEAQAPPAMRYADATSRAIVTHYVPINDVEISEALRRKCAQSGGTLAKADAAQALALLPERRPKQGRTFPRAWLADDTVYLTWDAAPSPGDRQALEALCRKVTRIGHSTSLVQVWVEEEAGAVEPTLVRTEGLADVRLRGTSRGLLDDLAARFRQTESEAYDRLTAAWEAAPTKKQQRELANKRQQRFPEGRPTPQRPVLGVWVGYRRPRPAPTAEDVAAGPFSAEILVLRRAAGHALGLESTLQLTGALRNAALKASPHSPEWLSGHTADGAPSQRPHVAFFPLPYVGHEHADGHLMGAAIAVPQEIEAKELQQHLGTLFFDPQTGQPREIRLWKNDRSHRLLWEWRVEREARESPPWMLRPETWTRPSRLWASVTPVVLHHYPKRNRPGDVERILRDACATARLPDPRCVEARCVSFHRGAGHVRQMPLLEPTPENLCRYQVHCRLEFSEEVAGPVLVGRGRYRGYGLFLPVRQGGGP